MMCINFNIEITNQKKNRFNIEIEVTKGKEK